MYDDEDTHEVPPARRGVPTYAPAAAPPVHRRREPSRRVRSAVVVGASSLLAGLVAVVLALGAFTVLDRDTTAIPTDVARPGVGSSAPVAEPEPADPVVADPPVELVADEPVVPFRAHVRLRTTDGLLTVRLSAPTTGGVRWTLVGPLGRVVDRRRLAIGPRAREIRLRGLAAGRFTWRVVPVSGGPTRRGAVAVAGVPLPPPSIYVAPPGGDPGVPVGGDGQQADRGGDQHDPPAPPRPPKPRKPPKSHQPPPVPPDPVGEHDLP